MVLACFPPLVVHLNAEPQTKQGEEQREERREESRSHLGQLIVIRDGERNGDQQQKARDQKKQAGEEVLFHEADPPEDRAAAPEPEAAAPSSVSVLGEPEFLQGTCVDSASALIGFMTSSPG